MNSKVQLKIDYREQYLIEKLKKGNIPFEIVPLDLGDIQFEKDNELYLIIERKTECDLQQSIKDGRWREQKERLDLIKNDTKVLYFIEQVEFSKRTNLDFKILQGAIINTLLRDNYSILYTECLEQTIEYLEMIYKKIEKGEFEKVRGSSLQTTSANIKKKLTKTDYYLIMLSSIPRVSLDTSKKIVEKYPNLLELIDGFNNNGKEVLADIVLGKKKLGKKLSCDIFEFLMDKNENDI